MRKSILGQKFGKLTVVGYEGIVNENSKWLCKCDCGNTKVINRPSLIQGTTTSCGCINCSNAVGQKFGKLLVVDFAGKKNGTTYWVCKCDCGKIAVVRRGHLKDTVSCGCSSNGKGQNSYNWKGYKDLSASFYRKIQGHAKRRKIEFNVGIAYLWELFEQQEGKCALTNIPLVMPTTNIMLHSGKGTASLDRIDSTKGYVEGNLQWTHKDVNFMKQQFTQEYFVEICCKIAAYKNANLES